VRILDIIDRPSLIPKRIFSDTGSCLYPQVLLSWPQYVVSLRTGLFDPAELFPPEDGGKTQSLKRRVSNETHDAGEYPELL
jgi:hypothetical protein